MVAGSLILQDLEIWRMGKKFFQLLGSAEKMLEKVKSLGFSLEGSLLSRPG